MSDRPFSCKDSPNGCHKFIAGRMGFYCAHCLAELVGVAIDKVKRWGKR